VLVDEKARASGEDQKGGRQAPTIRQEGRIVTEAMEVSSSSAATCTWCTLN
jgi:hypothetical protein